MSGPIVRIDRASRRFGDVAAIDDVSLDIAEGEFLALLGPPGCGKTTLLRMIAGLEAPTAGRILIDGIDVAGIAANRRPTSMVFQPHAVFPHMTVTDNIGYGLRITGIGTNERAMRVTEALSLVRLDGLGSRMPDQLSGAQRQRVALARALVMRPRILLLDQPLSATDAKLRTAMREELIAIRRRIAITFVMVTDDQADATALAERCVLMERGRIRQVGTPADLYERPADRFTAEFLGNVNLFEARIGDDGTATAAALGALPAPSGDARPGDVVWIAMRPELIALHADPVPGRIAGKVRRATRRGDACLFEIMLSTGEAVRVIRQEGQGMEAFRRGANIWLDWAAGAPMMLTR